MEQSLVSRIKYLLGSHWNGDIYIYIYIFQTPEHHRNALYTFHALAFFLNFLRSSEALEAALSRAREAEVDSNLLQALAF